MERDSGDGGSPPPMFGGDSWLLLHELRLRGMMPIATDAAFQELEAQGYAQRRGARLTVTASGRDAHAQWARLPVGTPEEAAVRQSYEVFLPLNHKLRATCTAWQVSSDGIPNDHRDTEYDWSVIDRLVEIDKRAGAILARVSAAAPRFSAYRPRLSDALTRVLDGDHRWFLSPVCESYHTVWMWLHEDLLSALGIARQDEPD